MSDERESPRTMQSSRRAGACANTYSKKRTSGLAKPISSETKMPSKSPRMPSASSLPYCAARVPLVIRYTLPRARQRSAGTPRAPGSRYPVRAEGAESSRPLTAAASAATAFPACAKKRANRSTHELRALVTSPRSYARPQRVVDGAEFVIARIVAAQLGHPRPRHRMGEALARGAHKIQDGLVRVQEESGQCARRSPP